MPRRSPQPHGPCWQWTRYDSGTTITRRLTQPQAALYQEWIANRRWLAGIVAEMEKVGKQAADLLLQRTTPSRRGPRPDSPPKPARPDLSFYQFFRRK
jgi:hypothetical protein